MSYILPSEPPQAAAHRPRQPSRSRIALQPELHAALSQLAKHEGHSVAGLITLLINEALDRRLRSTRAAR